jgi:O-antigen ligase/tetratricopeptide (TPR) repeat protein
MKLLEKVIKIGLGFALFTPLVIGQSLIFPLVTTKAYFFYILVDILFCLYIILLSRKSVSPNKNKLFYFFIAYILIGFIINIFGINFLQSFWGNYERMVGMYNYIHILLYLWILLSFYNTVEKYIKLLDISVFISVLVSIYGLLQLSGLKFFGLIVLRGERLSSTIGNAAYLSTYLLFHIFIIFYLFFKKKNISWRVFYVISFLLDLVVLFAAATRGALVGLVFSIFAMLFYIIIFYKNKQIKILSVLAILFLSILFSSIFVFKNTPFIKNNETLRRLSQISFNEGTSYSRILLWKISLKASFKKPLFGYGANNMRIPLDKYHDYNLQEDWFDSSHNQFLDELLSHGYVGLLIYLTFIIYVFVYIIKRRNKDFFWTILMFGLVVAYLVQSFFVFDSIMTIFIFSLIIGFFIISDNDRQEPICNNFKLNKIIVYLFLFIIVFGGIYIYQRTLLPAKEITRAYKIAETDIVSASEIIDNAGKKSLHNFDIVGLALAEHAVVILKNPQNYNPSDLKKFMEVFEYWCRVAIDKSNGYSKFYINLAKILQQAKFLGPNYVDSSISLLNDALILSPGRLDIYYALAQGYFYKNNIELAEDFLNKALSFGVKQGEIYLNLAEVQSRKGDPEKALESIKKSNEYQKMPFEKLETYAVIFVQREAWNSALGVFLMMNELKPADQNIYSNIALVYDKLGNKIKAKEWRSKFIQ